MAGNHFGVAQSGTRSFELNTALHDEESALLTAMVKVLLGAFSFAAGGAFAFGTGGWLWAVQEANPEYNDVSGGAFLIGAILGAAVTLPFGAIAGGIFARTGRYRRGLIATQIIAVLLGLMFYSAGRDSHGGGIAPWWILLAALGGFLATRLFTSLVVNRDESLRTRPTPP